MAYVEAHATLRNHPKTKKTARTLAIATPTVIGHLLCLWWWCQDYAQDGNLSNLSADEIAEAADWPNDPDTFVNALLNCGRQGEPGFLEIAEDGALLVHDWQEYGGKLFVKRQQAAKRQANWRERHTSKDVTPSNVTETLQDDVSNALLTHNVTQDNAYRVDKIRGEKKREEESTPPPPLRVEPPAAAGRKLSEKLAALNAKLSPALRTPLADTVLDITGKRALADAGDDGLLYGAHEAAQRLYLMGYKTDADLLAIEEAWLSDWRGKSGGGTFKQFEEFASERKTRRNGHSVEPKPTGKATIQVIIDGQVVDQEIKTHG